VTALQRYVHDIAVLAAVAPGLAAEVGESLMRVEETRDEATPLLGSGILALTSTRKQDLELTQADLAERLPELLSAAPDVAVRFLAAAVEAPAGQSGSGGPHRYPIRFGTVTGYLQPYGRPLQLLGDHHSAPAMADALAAHLRQLAEQPGTAEPAGQPGEDPDQDAVGRLLGLLVARVHHGGVWARLLAAGAAAPHGLGRRLLPLLETSALLAHRATRHAAGSLIRALGPLLTEPEHAALEDWILAVEAYFDLNDPEQAERAAHVRDQLLGCLTLERVQPSKHGYGWPNSPPPVRRRSTSPCTSRTPPGNSPSLTILLPRGLATPRFPVPSATSSSTSTTMSGMQATPPTTSAGRQHAPGCRVRSKRS
jgi:hypothetical protein